MASASSTPTPALRRLGKYRIIRPLSKGGMALVYEARRESLAGVSPRVAIKLVLPEFAESESFQRLFINEARLGAAMQHQNLVQIQDFDRAGDQVFLVMEYVEGITFRHMVTVAARHRRKIPLTVIAELGRQACEGLHYAHRATDEHGRHLELIHRDMKPSNLILNSHNVVKVLDFGISKGALTQEKQGVVKGTWGYMAPEQALGREVSPASDVFGLAIVLYELAALRPLFRDRAPGVVKPLLADDHAARMAAMLEPRYRSLIPVLIRALQRDPAARYVTASAFAQALSELLPDPITAADELARFYGTLVALQDGKAPPTPPPSSAPELHESSREQEADTATVGSSSPGNAGWLPLIAGLSGVIILVGMGLGLVSSGGDNLGTAQVIRSTGAMMPQTLLMADPTVQVRPPPVKPVRSAPATGESGAPVEAEGESEEEGPVTIVIERNTAKQVEEVEGPSEDIAPVVEEPLPPQTQPDPDDADVGWLTVRSAPRTLDYDVYVDGRFVSRGALERHPLLPGKHHVSISAADGRIKRFEISIEAERSRRRIWDFDRGEWRR